MHLLLLNNNPAVSRLIKLSIDKVGYELDEFEDYGLVPLEHYDLIMVDNECYNEADLETLCEQSSCQYVLYICQRGSKKPEFANMALEKPFLPTDFLILLEKIKNVLASLKPEEAKSVEEEIDLSEEEPELDLQNVAAFDIDGIDTFGIDEESSLEEDTPLEKEEMMLDALELQDEDDALDLPTFDLDTHEEDDLSLSFLNKEVNNEENDDDEIFISEETIAKNSVLHDSVEKEEEIEEVFNATSILDKDEINEVKQLLDESEEEDFDLESAFDVSGKESLEEELLDENDGDLLLQETAVKSEEDALDLDDSLGHDSLEEEEKELSFEETPLSVEDIEEDMLESEIVAPEEESVIPTQEEIIDDFEDVIEEKIEEELEMAMDDDLKVLSQIGPSDFDSLDDLNENAIKRAFGEEVEEVPEVSVKKNEDVAVIRGEIENTIARSLSGLAQSDILREALKGMRINISITFDEKN